MDDEIEISAEGGEQDLLLEFTKQYVPCPGHYPC